MRIRSVRIKYCDYIALRMGHTGNALEGEILGAIKQMKKQGTKILVVDDFEGLVLFQL